VCVCVCVWFECIRSVQRMTAQQAALRFVCERMCGWNATRLAALDTWLETGRLIREDAVVAEAAGRGALRERQQQLLHRLQAACCSSDWNYTPATQRVHDALQAHFLAFKAVMCTTTMPY
jgi:hypothetical protein